jgi:hypothetical protein
MVIPWIEMLASETTHNKPGRKRWRRLDMQRQRWDTRIMPVISVELSSFRPCFVCEANPRLICCQTNLVYTGEFPKVAGKMALTEEARRVCDIGKRQIDTRRHLLSLFQAPPRDIRMRRNADCPVELAREMTDGEAGDRGAICELEPLGQVLLDVHAYAAEDVWRKPAMNRGVVREPS